MSAGTENQGVVCEHAGKESKLEEGLVTWSRNIRSCGAVASGAMLIEKAKAFGDRVDEHRVTAFDASILVCYVSNSYDTIKDRHRVCLMQVFPVPSSTQGAG